MSKQGYHLSKPGFFGRYEFEQGEPRNLRLQNGFHDRERKIRRIPISKCSLMRAGSTLASLGAGSTSEFWLRKMRSLKIYTDTVSKNSKNTVRVLLLLVILFPIYLLPLNLHNILERDPHWLMTGILILWVILLFVYGISAIKILGRIEELRKTIKAIITRGWPCSKDSLE